LPPAAALPSFTTTTNQHLWGIKGHQQLSKDAVVVSGAAVRLALELTLLASGAVQRQRQQHRRQQQQQKALTPAEQTIADKYALSTWSLLVAQIKVLVASSRSCLPPEVLQQAELQLLQALAAPLQRWQPSRAGDSFCHNAAAAGALLQFGGALHL
jgi:hypothetical protein